MPEWGRTTVQLARLQIKFSEVSTVWRAGRRFEIRFKMPSGRQARAGFAEFKAEFTDEPGVLRRIQLFSFVPGKNRWVWEQFCFDQKPETVLRLSLCHG